MSKNGHNGEKQPPTFEEMWPVAEIEIELEPGEDLATKTSELSRSGKSFAIWPKGKFRQGSPMASGNRAPKPRPQ